MSTELSTKFNTNSLLRFNSTDKEKHLTFGTYNGQARMSFGPTEFVQGKLPKAIILTPPVRYNLLSLCEYVINNAAPGVKKTITINGLWNEETRRRELSSTITVGMDDATMCYIGIKHTDKDRETFTGKFELTGDRYMEIVGDYDTDTNRSMSTLKMLHEILKGPLLTVGGLLNRNHLVQPNFNKSNKKSSSSSNSSDIDF